MFSLGPPSKVRWSSLRTVQLLILGADVVDTREPIDKYDMLIRPLISRHS